jgi:hypothetical protein
MRHPIFKYLAILITGFSAIMIWWHWDHHEVSAWIIAFTGWLNYSLDMIQKDKNHA